MQAEVKKAIAVVLAVTVLTTPAARAGWVDDWVTQKTETAPGYFEGQKRGYFNAGGFSARWPMKNDYLFTIEKPRIKAGCGGIDMFMGGFGFLDVDYLLQKLQKILTSPAAASVAFDIGLNIVCEQCSKAITKFEAIVDALNNLQLDDCRASKAGVVALAGAAGLKDQIPQKYATAIEEFKQSSGVSNLWQAGKDFIGSIGGDPTKIAPGSSSHPQRVLDGCPAQVRAVFNTEGSIFGNLGGIGAASPGPLSLAKGLLGDVRIVMSNSVPQVKVVPACSKNNPQKLEDIYRGQVEVMDESGSCGPLTDATANLEQWASNQMLNIAGKIRSGGALTAEEDAFIQNSPLAIGNVLKMAVGTKQETSIIANLANLTAKAYAYQMILDAYSKVHQALQAADAIDRSVQAGERCNLEILADFRPALEAMADRTYRYSTAMRAAYAASVNEATTLQQFVSRMEQFNNQANRIISGMFGPAVARRAISQ